MRRAADQRSVEIADLREERGRHVVELERAASALVAAEGALSASERVVAAQTRRVRLLGLVLVALAALVLVVGAVAVAGWVR